MATFFDNPPILQGQAEDKLRQLYSYLSAMSDKLNAAQTSITIEQFTPETQQVIGEAAKNTQAQYDGLKSMIIKTAEIVRHEMDMISTELHDDYSALSSQFGEYQRNLTGEITATAEGILQEYQFQERITGLEEGSDDYVAFERRINQYIFSGLVDEQNGRYGIAIGENVTAYDNDGNPYLDNNRKTATFTMDELAFWHGTTKIAYFTDNVFHIAHGEVVNSMKMGNFTWTVMNGALGLISGG